MATGYLLDTNVVSEMSPTKQALPTGLAEWLRMRHDRLFLSVTSIAEIVAGVEKLRRIGGTRKAERILQWLGLVERLYGDRLLVIDRRVAWEAGAFIDLTRLAGTDPGFADLAIAATASVHRLTLLTRNLKDFKGLPVEAVDPFTTEPDPVTGELLPP